MTSENEGVNDDVCNSNGIRFVRLNPRFDPSVTIQLLTSELPSGTTPIPVPWLKFNDKMDETNSSRCGQNHSYFYALPDSFRLNKSHSYTSGRVHGMDVSSGACVAALLFDIFDCSEDPSKIYDSSDECNRILDLCCAPGLKTCAIADMLAIKQARRKKSLEQTDAVGKTSKTSSTAKASIIGIDISQQRLNICKRIVTKYLIHPDTSFGDTAMKRARHVRDATNENDQPIEKETDHTTYPSNMSIRLYCADGTTFGTEKDQSSILIFDSEAAKEEYHGATVSRASNKRKRMNKSARAREKKRLLALAETTVKMELFDRVLVDAECSTDGAIRHIEKKSLMNRGIKSNDMNEASKKVDPNGSDPNCVDDDRIKNLTGLQKQLIENGFRLTKPGGVMVYSTCSLSKEQNEEVCQSLLEKYPSAFIIPLTFNNVNAMEQRPFAESSKQMVINGDVKGTLRFLPNTSESMLFGGGFFIAKIGKKLSKPD